MTLRKLARTEIHDMANAPDVSVIIPTYNRLWCLPKAVESCRNTGCRSQIIVVDDGSVDGTWEWLQQQADLLAIRQSNQGQTWAINRGFAAAQGRYIRFLDSDDFLCPGIIDRQYQAALASGADLIYSRVDTYRHPQGLIIEAEELQAWNDFMAVQLGEANASHFLGMLFKRELIEKVPRRPDFAYREDRMFLLEIGLLSPSLAHVPGRAGYWVQHADQMQANYRGIKATVVNWQHLHIYRRVLAELDRRSDLTPRRKRAAARVLWPLAHWIGYTHPEEAAEVADWIYQLDPGFRPPEPGWLGTFYRRLGFRKTEALLRLRRSTLEKRAFFRLPRVAVIPGARPSDVPSARSAPSTDVR
jgi:glycosyltransferase involved in cell wall biosynthesis